MTPKRTDESHGLARDGLRLALLLHADEAEALRERAYKERRSQASIVREALRRFLKIPD